MQVWVRVSWLFGVASRVFRLVVVFCCRSGDIIEPSLRKPSYCPRGNFGATSLDPIPYHRPFLYAKAKVNGWIVPSSTRGTTQALYTISTVKAQGNQNLPIPRIDVESKASTVPSS